MFLFSCSFLILLCCWVFFTAAAPPSCTTPNGEQGSCVPLHSCKILLEAAGDEDPSVQQFLEKSSCGSGKTTFCCGTTANFVSTTKAPEPENKHSTIQNGTKGPEHREMIIKNYIPSKRYCGFQHTDDYVHSSNATSLDEFPWLIYITVYTTPTEEEGNPYELRCAGVLISGRYALTASECDAFSFDTITLGKYNRFKDTDCATYQYTGVSECSDPEVTAKVEEKIKYENGILLLRLAKQVFFNDYVRPICLPLNETQRAKVGNKLITSGWGDASLEDSNVKEKKRVEHILRNPLEKSNVFVNSTNYEDCYGDEGGPLMYKDKKYQWFVEAIVPPYFCFHNYPARRISQETIDWIIDNVRE